MYSRIEELAEAEGLGVDVGDWLALALGVGVGAILMVTPEFQTLLAPLFTQVNRLP